MRQSKTKEVKVIQSHFGSSWDDEAIYDRSEYPQIKNDLAEYRKDHYGSYRVITRRIKL